MFLNIINEQPVIWLFGKVCNLDNFEMKQYNVDNVPFLTIFCRMTLSASKPPRHIIYRFKGLAEIYNQKLFKFNFF